MKRVFRLIKRRLSQKEQINITAEAIHYHKLGDNVKYLGNQKIVSIAKISEFNSLIIDENYLEKFKELTGSSELGIYLFNFPFKSNYQRIILGDDLIQNALIISSIIVRSNQDDSLPLDRLETLSTSRFVGLTCTKACKFVQYLLKKINVKSRVALTLTSLSENYYNDGHTLLEVYDDIQKKYFVVDIDKKCYFTHEKGNKLNAYELCKSVQEDCVINIQSYHSHNMVDWLSFKSDDYSFQFLEQMFYSNKEQQLNLYKRICQVLVFSDGDNYFSSDTGLSLDNNWKIKVQLLQESEFLKKYY